jgi:hypothetical protein
VAYDTGGTKMKERQEKILEININLTQRLVTLLIVVLLVIVSVGYMAWGQQQVSAANSQVSQVVIGARQFYLTENSFSGNETLTACDEGYHMASIWEILDTSNLRYDTTMGVTLDDSGQGPPSAPAGWARTGFSSNISNTASMGNCNAWTSNASNDYGRTIYLPYSDLSVGSEFGVWRARMFQCDQSWRVWCVTDKWGVGYIVYLPIVLRH